VGLFDDIRHACQTVSQRATFVRIDPAQVAACARSLPVDALSAPSLDPAHHHAGTPEGTLTFVLILDAVNFGSGYFPHLLKRPGLSGYLTVATSFKEWFEAREARPVPAAHVADVLAEFTAEDCARILAQPVQPATEPIGELMSLFARALNDLGRYVRQRFDGVFSGLVEAADHSAEKLVRSLEPMPFYRDVHRYGDLEVPFYKRAQITAADLSIALRDHPWGRFDDVNELTIFADNLVPHVLRVDGLLQYVPELQARIEQGGLIRSGSPEEIEIRACGVTAVEMLVAQLRTQGTQVCARDLDYYLWNRGQQPRYKSHPRHRTRCVYY
jgi:hypothetical protein